MNRTVQGLVIALVMVAPAILCGQTSLELHQAFLDLSNDRVLMDLSAHPDDEDGATLAFYRMKYGVKTYSILFTRGEGGQNEKGPELYEALGVLRSAETEAAGRILGADVRFLNFLDFGYSKTASEAFRKWGGQMEVLRRLVFAIRKMKPDVLMTNHNTIDGHGHHQAVAITAIAAFDAAADSSVFPEQLKLPGISVWQPRKLFFRVFGRGAETADVTHPIDEVDSVRGKAYIDIASEALRMHRTQGLDHVNLRAFTRGKSLYRLMRANSIYDQDTTDFFSGIDLWSDPAVAPLKPIHDQVREINPSLAGKALLPRISRAMKLIDELESSVRLSPLGRRMAERWRDNLSRIVELTSGMAASFRFLDSVAVPGQKVPGELSLSVPEGSLEKIQVRFDVPSGWAIGDAPEASPKATLHSYQREYVLTVGEQPHFTLPRVLAQYTALEADEHVLVNVECNLEGFRLRMTLHPWLDVAPPEELSITPVTAGLTTFNRRAGATYSVVIKNCMPHKTAGTLSVHGPAGWRGESIPYVLDGEDSSVVAAVHLLPPDSVHDGEYPVTFQSNLANLSSTVNVFDVRVAPDIRVGIIGSYDNTLEGALGDLGVNYDLLTEHDLQSGDLSKYQTIVIDIRAYLVREDLKRWNPRLLEYASAGGNLLVTYQRDQEWKPEYAPFPLQITRRRVTVEEAPVEILVPDHPLLNKPNKISALDWDGWKQERGLYFPGDVAPEYTKLLSTHDPDEAPLSTGYLVAKVGRGSYIYTSLVWYRQLKDHNSGAFRCFANMISYASYRK